MPTERALLGEFDTPAAIERAVDALKSLGYERMEAYTPHPMPELEAKLGIPRSRAPRVALIAGVVGALLAFSLQYWLNGVDFPLNVGGRPLLSAPAFIPITFEAAVLFAALASFVAWLVVSRLPTLDDPILAVEGFTSVSIDRFWLAVVVGDPPIDAERGAERLRGAGALRVVLMPEDEQ